EPLYVRQQFSGRQGQLRLSDRTQRPQAPGRRRKRRRKGRYFLAVGPEVLPPARFRPTHRRHRIMKLSLEDSKALGIEFLTCQGMPADHAAIVADHLIYATLAGHDFAGFSRLLPIAEQLRLRGTG